MLKERLNKISTKIFYIIFALLVSVTLWLYVEITENEVIALPIENIAVVFKNQDILHDRSLLISSWMPENLSMTIEGSRSDISRLSAPGAITAEVDLVNVTSVGTQPLTYQFIFPQGFNQNDINIRDISDSRITMIFDRMFTRQIDVRVSPYTGGTAAPGELVAEAVDWDPKVITIRGPEEIISRISYARVPIFRENLERTYTDDLEFVLIDENGEVLSDEIRELIEYSDSLIRVTVPIKEIKDIVLNVDLWHGESTSDANTQVSITPQYITVSGDPDALREFNSIQLGNIDMLRFSLTSTQPFPIIIPNNLVNISGETSALVHVDVLGVEIAYHSTTNIQTINDPPGYRITILTQSLDVRLRGTSENLSLVDEMNIRVVADLADMNPGTSRISARVLIDGIDADIDPVGEYLITVRIQEE